MAYCWNHRRHVFRLLAGLLVCAVLFLSGCTPFWIRFPWDMCDRWVCQDPEFSLTYYRDADGWLISEESLQWNGEIITVEIGFTTSEFVVFPLDNPSFDNRLLQGTWGYKRGNLVLYIKEDFLFDGAFDKLIFFPQRDNEETGEGRGSG